MRLCLCACMRLYMCLHVHRGPCQLDFLGKYILQSEVKLILAIILHLSPAIQLTICVHPSMHVSVCACMHMCMCLHVSVHNIMCSAGPEVAVLDWYGPEADPVDWRRGRGVVVAGLQVACEAHFQGGKYWASPPEKIGNLDHLIYLVLQIFSVGSHCQGIVTFPSTPISLSCLFNSSCALV